MTDQQLRIPGPTPLPERVMKASGAQMINHRGPEFAALIGEICSGLQEALGTSNDVLIFPASGSGGLEAVIANMVGPGERALFCAMGSFGQRWTDMARAYGVDVVTLVAEPGFSIDPGALDAALSEDGAITTVFITHNETSTGVTNDVGKLASVVKRHGRFLCVDTVSGAPCIPLAVDELGIDVAVAGSQKGWMAPPGVTMIAVNEAAMTKSASVRNPRWYLDFKRERDSQRQGQTATTPALGVLFALREGLAMIREEGMAACWERHARIAGRIQTGLNTLGLTLMAQPEVRSNTVTAVLNPTGSPDGLKSFLNRLREEHKLVLAGGQGGLRGKIFRVGHLGYIHDQDAEVILNAIGLGLQHVDIVETADPVSTATSAA